MVNSKKIFYSTFLMYILAFSIYILELAPNTADVISITEATGLSKFHLLAIGLIGNIVTILITVNFTWFLTSLGISIFRGDNIQNYPVKKSVYYSIYFSIYSLFFITMNIIYLFIPSTISNDLLSMIKYMNIVVIPITCISILLYMKRVNVITKLSLSGIIIIGIVNWLYTFFII